MNQYLLVLSWIVCGTTGAWDGDTQRPGSLQGDAQEGADENGGAADFTRSIQ